MAGGTFDKLAGKVRPGTYINFVSTRNEVVGINERGIMAIPLFNHDYGPTGEFIRLDSSAPDAQYAKLGYSIYDDDPHQNMLLLREAFKHARTVYAYVPAEGTKAKAEVDMVLAELEVSDFEKTVMENIKEKVGAGESMSGCNLSFNSRTRTMTVTLLGEVTAVHGTGLVAAVTSLRAEDYKITVDGTELNDLASITSSPAYKKVEKLTKGSADIRFTVNISKNDDSAEFTVVVSYPNSPPGQEQGLTDTTPSTNKLTAEAKYGGTRGNALTVTVDANPLGGWNVLIHLDENKVAEYDGLNTIEELIEADDPYVTFTGEGLLGGAAGTHLENGEDGKQTNIEVTKFLDALEGIRANTVCFPITDKDLQQAAATKIKYMRESMGRGIQLVMPDAKGCDYEGIINVTNSVKLDDLALTHAQACAWVAGVTASASNVQSNTYVAYEGATEVVDPKSHEEAVAAINNGEFFFSVSEDNTVIVEYDINSLVTFRNGKDRSYRKNRVIRVLDTFGESIASNFPPNKFDNDETGWPIMEGIGKAILKQFGPKPEGVGAIRNVDFENDFKVDQSLSADDSTYFNVSIQPTDSAEKLYFTIATR